ncbi:Ldh family oxidoreductase [Sorangium sp. So ce1389]|uniref:Ldh family oxidoreductase n=1 Tax=Sorangium sp. So ce1389 TaxID=3133336 RepID=UPI003F5E9657
MKASRADIESLCARAFERAGMNERERAACTDEVIDAEWRGKKQFGVVLAPHVVEWHRKKRAEPEITDRGPIAAFIEGNDTVGPLVSKLAMDLAIEKARAAGVGYVGIRNHTPWLLAGYHPRRAAERGLIGATWSVGVKIAAPHGGRQAVFGTNPLGVAVPSREGPIVLDMACTKGSATALRDPPPMPEGIAVDARGEPTTDPAKARKGALLVFGEHKGSGVAMMIELLAGAWLGSKTGRSGPGPRGAVFFAARTDLFGFGDGFEDRAEQLAHDVAASGYDDRPPPRVPGRHEVDFTAETEVDDAALEALRKLGDPPGG